MFSMLVIFYLFLGGCGGGLIFVVSVWSLLFHRGFHRTAEASKSFSDVKKICYTVGLLLVALAAACLVIDLGRPAYFYLLFIRPNNSVLSFGSFVLAITALLALFLVIANVFLSQISSKVKKIGELLCAISSFLLITYVGVFLQSMGTVPFWNSPVIPALFILSSLSTGIALLFLIIPFTGEHELLEGHTSVLHVNHRIVMALEVIALVLLLWLASLHWTSMRSLELLFQPGMVPWFFVGAVGFGILVPLLAEVSYALMKKRVFLPFFCTLCLIGSLCLRYCIVSVGVY